MTPALVRSEPGRGASTGSRKGGGAITVGVTTAGAAIGSALGVTIALPGVRADAERELIAEDGKFGGGKVLGMLGMLAWGEVGASGVGRAIYRRNNSSPKNAKPATASQAKSSVAIANTVVEPRHDFRMQGIFLLYHFPFYPHIA